MFYALTYIVMFAVPIFGLRGVTPRPPLWLKVASWSGLLMTVLYVALSIFPIIQVASVTTFALKISLVILVANAIGIGLYVSARPRASSIAITEA
jgi:nitrate reductase NapE component